MFKILLASVMAVTSLAVQAGNDSASSASTATQEIKKKAKSATGYNGYCVGYNSNNGNWQVFSYPQPPSMDYINTLSSPLKETLLNLRNSFDHSSACRIEVITNYAIPPQLQGGSLYFGYGLSLDEMVQSGRFSLIYSGL
jgi:hypothetical protein